MPPAIRTPEDLARAVRVARIDRGLRQDDLALASGTGRRFIVDLERGKPTLRLNSVLAVLEALDLHLELSDDHPDLAPGDGPEGAGPNAGA